MSSLKKPVKIAMVDDHILIRDALATVIDRFDNCKVILLAAHGKELLEKLQPDNLPDLVILDLNMPEMDGYMLMQEVKTRYFEQNRVIPAIALTAYAGEFNQQQALQAGFQVHLAKPIEPDELAKAIARLI